MSLVMEVADQVVVLDPVASLRVERRTKSSVTGE
jgi:hypothetical protein